VSSKPRTRLSSADAAGDVELSMDDAEAAHMHRLQRQDAKSRKTFKIKRNRSTIKASSGTVARSATVKVSGECLTDAGNRRRMLLSFLTLKKQPRILDTLQIAYTFRHSASVTRHNKLQNLQTILKRTYFMTVIDGAARTCVR